MSSVLKGRIRPGSLIIQKTYRRKYMKFLYYAFGWCLAFFYKITGSYGWAIVLFSLFSQVIMLPISLKQAKAMEKQKLITPETEKIKAKYPHDTQRQNEEISKLFTANNYNPLSGCLPILLQFPIIIGLFGALRQPELYVFSAEEYAAIGQSFLWIKNMTVTPLALIKSVGFTTETFMALILPVACVLLTFLQQKLTTVDKSQQSMMFVMTAMIGYFSLTVSQGICIYWTLRTVLGIIQQKVIEKKPMDINIPVKTPRKKK